MENPLFRDAATKVIAKAIEEHNEYQEKGYIGPSLAKWIRDALDNEGLLHEQRDSAAGALDVR